MIIKMKARNISAVTLFVKNMTKSFEFYSKIPGFRVVCGGPSSDFTSFEVGENKMYLNLELKKDQKESHFGRIVFHVDDVDEIYDHLKNDKYIFTVANFENKPIDASWGERFFHIIDPDNYQLSFATPINVNETECENDLISKKKQRYKSVYKKRYRQQQNK